MQSSKRLVLISALTLSSIGLLASGCASAPPIVAGQSAPCSSMVAPSLLADVEPVPLPSEDATAGELWTAFDGQTGRLDVSNLKRRASMETIERCEARDAAAVERITAPWWKRPFLRQPDPG